MAGDVMLPWMCIAHGLLCPLWVHLRWTSTLMCSNNPNESLVIYKMNVKIIWWEKFEIFMWFLLPSGTCFGVFVSERMRVFLPSSSPHKSSFETDNGGEQMRRVYLWSDCRHEIRANVCRGSCITLQISRLWPTGGSSSNRLQKRHLSLTSSAVCY